MRRLFCRFRCHRPGPRLLGQLQIMTLDPRGMFSISSPMSQRKGSAYDPPPVDHCLPTARLSWDNDPSFSKARRPLTCVSCFRSIHQPCHVISDGRVPRFLVIDRRSHGARWRRNCPIVGTKWRAKDRSKGALRRHQISEIEIKLETPQGTTRYSS